MQFSPLEFFSSFFNIFLVIRLHTLHTHFTDNPTKISYINISINLSGKLVKKKWKRLLNNNSVLNNTHENVVVTFKKSEQKKSNRELRGNETNKKRKHWPVLIEFSFAFFFVYSILWIIFFSREEKQLTDWISQKFSIKNWKFSFLATIFLIRDFHFIFDFPTIFLSIFFFPKETLFLFNSTLFSIKPP